MKAKILLLFIVCLSVIVNTVTIGAQDDPTPIPVTADEVNRVASQMYCPICEMEPLDTCGASTCVLWRQQIREELEAGRTQDEIVASFIERYGERVVGIPDDPTLRNFSYFGPIAVGVLSLLVALFTFLRWRKPKEIPLQSAQANNTASTHTDSDDETYLSQLENDLRS